MRPPSFPENWKVFPCFKGTKKPATGDGWPEQATDDPEQIAAWATAIPDCNWAVAMGPSGLAALDPDGPEGEASLVAFELAEGALPTTRVHGTPRGGRHLIFSDPKHKLRNSVGKLGPKLDTRGSQNGKAGYIVIPPSTFEGKPYVCLDDAEPAPLPDFVVEALGRAREAAETPEGFLPDLPVNIGRFITHLKFADPAIEGKGGEPATLAIGYAAHDLGVSLDVAHPHILEHYNPRCVPPWDADELAAKIGNAFQYPQNEFGCHAVRPASSTITPEALESLIASAPDSRALLQGEPISFGDVLRRTVPPVQEIIAGLVERQTVTFLSAPGGSHKSRLAVQWGLSIDAGVPIFGRSVERCAFHYLSYEDHSDEVARRAQSIARRLSLPHDTDAQFWDLSGQDAPLAIVHESGEIETKPLWDKLRRRLMADGRHKFVVIDSTYNALRFAGAAKINEGAVMAGIGLLQRLCDECNCTLLVLWHPSQAGQERGDASGWSVAWHNAPRARLSLTPVQNVEDAFNLKVEKRNHGRKGDPITLHWSDGVLLPRNQTDTAAHEASFRQAVVRVAIVAAEHGAPIQKQRRLEKWQLDEIEADVGRRPPEREVKDALAAALPAGLLRYIGGSQHRTAGYYPADQQRALELANAAKHGATKGGDHA